MQRISCVATLAAASLFAVLAGCAKESSAAGRSNTRLSLSKPANQSMTQGTSNKVAISIDRGGFADAVKVAFSNLPRGVRVDEGQINAGESSHDFVLIAAPDAQLVENHNVTVTARGSGIETTQTFELTVKAK